MASRLDWSSLAAAMLAMAMLSLLGDTGAWPPNSDPNLTSERVGENSELLDSLGSVEANLSGVKNVVTKEYSAVALSIRTNRRDRKSASMGSF
jgi:hypothetical protein